MLKQGEKNTTFSKIVKKREWAVQKWPKHKGNF